MSTMQDSLLDGEEIEVAVLTNYKAASTPQSAIAKEIAAEAAETAKKLSSGDKKAGTLRILSGGRADLFTVNPYLIRIKPDWNSRDANAPDNLAHIDFLARSISEIGVKQPLTVVLEGEDIFVTDGHCRLLATYRAIEVYGAEIKGVRVTTEERNSSEADHVLSQIVRNSGKKLSVIETGRAFLKLMSFGWTADQIGKKAGLGGTRVNQIVDLVGASSQGIREMLSAGSVKAATVQIALNDAKKTGGTTADAELALSMAVRTAKEAGKKVATPKHLKPAVPKAANAKASVRAMIAERAEVDTSDGDYVTIKLTAEDYRVLARMLDL